MLPMLYRDIKSDINAVARNIEKQMNEFFDTDDLFPSVGRSFPKVNITENETNFTVEAAVPGFQKDSVKVETVDHEGSRYLVLRAEKSNKQSTESRYHKREIHYSSFHRTWLLPDEVNTEKINASFSDGILTVVLPKTAPTKVAPVTKEVKIS